MSEFTTWDVQAFGECRTCDPRALKESPKTKYFSRPIMSTQHLLRVNTALIYYQLWGGGCWPRMKRYAAISARHLPSWNWNAWKLMQLLDVAMAKSLPGASRPPKTVPPRFVFSLILVKLHSPPLPRLLVFTGNRGKNLKTRLGVSSLFWKDPLSHISYAEGCFACLEQYYFHIFHIMLAVYGFYFMWHHGNAF